MKNLSLKNALKVGGAITLGSISGLSYANEPLDNSRVQRVAEEIPEYFTRVNSEVYLIENIPESKNGYTKGGRLTVFIPYIGNDSLNHVLSIFDRTDSNPENWYNVANWSYPKPDSLKGKAGIGIYLNNVRSIDQIKSQELFNEFIEKVETKIDSLKDLKK